MSIIDKLTEYFKNFPGIGDRQARRFVYFLMHKNITYSEKLADSIKELKKETSQCKHCFRYFPEAKKNVCSICDDDSRDKNLIMVVAKEADLENIEKTGTFKGKYFVLGGLIPLIDKPTEIRMKELFSEIKRRAKNENLKEVILALPLTPQGEQTEFILKDKLEDAPKKIGVKISTLGRGLSTGTELEYSDDETIKNALKNRG